MASSTKAYTLPQGLMGLLDPSNAETAYIQGIARAGTPAGLLQTGLMQARDQRENWVSRLFDESAGLADRTERLNTRILDDNNNQTYIKMLMDIAQSANPSMANMSALPAKMLRDKGTIGDQMFTDLLNLAGGTTQRLALNDEATRFEKTGAGVQKLADGGYRPVGERLTPQGMLGSEYDKGDPIAIEREKIDQVGKTARETLPKTASTYDQYGRFTGSTVTAPTTVGALRSGAQIAPNLSTQGSGPTPPTAPDAGTATRVIPQKQGAATPPARSEDKEDKEGANADYTKPTPRGDIQRMMADMSTSTESVAYGGHMVYPQMQEYMRDADNGTYGKPAPGHERGWVKTPDGIVRDFIGKDGKRRRIVMQPLPGGGVSVFRQREE